MSTECQRLVPVLPVDSIEKVLPFWEALGFTRSIEVPHGDRLGFVILAQGDAVQVMYQTYDSITEDVPALAESVRHGPTYVFVNVADIDAVEIALKGYLVFLPRRLTFYGATEIGYRDPAGHYVTFAQFAEKA